MAITKRFVVKKTVSGGTSLQTDTGSNTTSGDTLVVGVGEFNTDYGVTDNKGNTFTAVATVTGGIVTGKFYCCQNANGGADHQVTVTWNTGTADGAAYFAAFGGVGASSLDSGATGTTNNDTSTPYEVSTGTLAQAANYVIVLGTSDGSVGVYSESNGFTIDQREENNALFWTSFFATKLVAATDPVTASVTTTEGVGSGVGLAAIVIKEASAAATSFPPTSARLSMGARLNF